MYGYVHADLRTYACRHTHICIHTRLCMYVCVFITYICIRRYVNANVHTYVDVIIFPGCIFVKPSIHTYKGGLYVKLPTQYNSYI